MPRNMRCVLIIAVISGIETSPKKLTNEFGKGSPSEINGSKKNRIFYNNNNSSLTRALQRYFV